MKQTPKRKRLLAFLPAAIIIGVVAGTAAGISLIPSATAADIIVTGSVTASVITPATPTGPGLNDGTGGTCDAATPSGGGDADFVLPGDWVTTAAQRTAGVCRVTFGATNGQAHLTFNNGNAGPFWCNTVSSVRTCGGNNEVADIAGGPQDLSTRDRFGIALQATSNAAGAGTIAADATPLVGDSSWHGIPAAPAPFCTSAVSGAAWCEIRLGGFGKVAQNNGDYSGTLVMTAVGI